MADKETSQELHKFAENYDNYPDLASNVAIDAQEAGEPEVVVGFFEMLGDTYLEDKDQVISMIDQIDETDPGDSNATAA